MTNAQTCK